MFDNFLTQTSFYDLDISSQLIRIKGKTYFTFYVFSGGIMYFQILKTFENQDTN